MTNVISCNNLSKQFPSGFLLRRKKSALDKVSFQVGKGEVFGIVGPNGAGKSTTLKILMGFIFQDQGDATINEIPTNSATSREHIGYLPENPTLYHNLTVKDHLRFALTISENIKSNTSNTISAVLETVDLQEVANIPIRQFSKGMMQRAGLAYALIREPKILILDEPMSGLDPLGRQLVTDIIDKYHALGTTILFCSHILTDVERVCDRLAIMNNGKIIDITTPESVRKNHSATNLIGEKTPLEKYFLEQIKGTST